MKNEQVVSINEALRDFTLPDQNKQSVSISGFKGKHVLLSFHPLAWTSICGEQMKSLEKNKQRFADCNTVALGISVDSVPSKKAWAEKELGITSTQLLADFWPHGEAAQKLGIFREQEGISERANIIVSPEQKYTFVKIYEISQLPDIEEIIQFLKQQGGSS